jgi:glutamyl/glutaminyl-tRNA synthetase
VLDYLRDGYLPDALINFIASMGWNDGTEQEIFSRDELIEKFKLNHVQKSGARFDERRLEWLNGSYIRTLSLDTLFDAVHAFWPVEASNYEADYRLLVLGLVQERLKYFAELADLTNFFFTDLPLNPELISNNKQLKKFTSLELKAFLVLTEEKLQASDFSAEDLTVRLNGLLEETQQKPAVLFSLIRIATTQAPASPGLAETMAVLGKKRSLSRLQAQINVLN